MAPPPGSTLAGYPGHPHCPPMLRRGILLSWSLALAALWPAGRAAELALKHYDQVEVAPAKTSIYVGSVSLTMPAFARAKDIYSSTYVAKVFPYFFYNEKGTLKVEFSDEMLRRLERGEAVEFKGRAERDDGAERRVEGKATPADATSGKIKVRVFYSKRIELIFNTTYRFAPH